MALFHITHFSRTLGKECELTVVAPDHHQGTLRVVYQLHGYGDGPGTWLRHTAIERHACQHSLMVVMPDGGKGWYSDAYCGSANHESHVLETITFIDQQFHTVNHRCGRGIGGCGMGGYGAMKLALKHPEIFGSVAVHAGIYHPQHIPEKGATRDRLLHAIFGEHIEPDEDCLALAKGLSRQQLPAIAIDCGTRDDLLVYNRGFHENLKALGLPHRYDEFPGGHSWAYFDAHLPEALAFHAGHLRVKAS